MSCIVDADVPHSLDLLNNDDCINGFDTYSIRYHDAIKRGPHFDYAIGAYNMELCVDFIIPKKLTPVELSRGDNLPLVGERKMVLFQPAHDSSVIFGKVGIWNVIPAGEYGAGKWKIVRTGSTSIQRTGAHSYDVRMDNVVYKLFKPSNFENFLIIRTK